MPGAPLTPTDYPSLTGDYGDITSYNYYHFTGALSANTGIKATMGVVHTITVNQVATAGTLTILDGSSGTTVATVDLTKQVPYTYDVKLNNGIYAQTTGLTGSPSVTIAYA